MTLHYTPIAVVMLISAGIAVAMAIIAWQRRRRSASIIFMLAMLAIAVWTIGRAFEGAAVEVSAKIFWAKTEYLGIASLPVFWLLFVLKYTHLDKWITRQNIALLSIMPAVTLVLVATNEQHGLIWEHITPNLGVASEILVYDHGLWFWIFTVFSYILLLIGSLRLLCFALHSQDLYRSQSVSIIIGSIIPWLSNVIYLAGLSPIPGLDLTPPAFAVSGLVLGWGIFRHRLLDLVPIARHALVEHMSDGVIVVDIHDRIVDINPSARSMLGRINDRLVGERASNVFAAWPDVMERYRAVNNSHIEIQVGCQAAPRYIDLRISPLHDAHNRRTTGQLIVLRDITQRRNAEFEACQTNEQLRQQLVEIEFLHMQLREQATRDPLTNLFNRRYMEETLERELARATRENQPISVAMIDIDYFKQLNDTFGHKAGDMMLQALAGLIKAYVRQQDVVCRYGGEEFLVIMPGASLETACQRAEIWRKGAEALRIGYGMQEVRATLSLGIAVFPNHGATIDALLYAADNALYNAKNGGRNRVIIWNDNTLSMRERTS